MALMNKNWTVCGVRNPSKATRWAGFDISCYQAAQLMKTLGVRRDEVQAGENYNPRHCRTGPHGDSAQTVMGDRSVTRHYPKRRRLSVSPNCYDLPNGSQLATPFRHKDKDWRDTIEQVRWSRGHIWLSFVATRTREVSPQLFAVWDASH